MFLPILKMFRRKVDRKEYARIHSRVKVGLPKYIFNAFRRSMAEQGPPTLEELCRAYLPEILAEDSYVGLPMRSGPDTVYGWLKGIVYSPAGEKLEKKECMRKQEVGRYVKGELRNGYRKGIEIHIPECLPCRHRFLRDVLEGWPGEDAEI